MGRFIEGSEPRGGLLHKQSFRRGLWFRAFLLGTVAAAAVGHAGILFDSGTVTFSNTGTQFGRITRDGNASEWGDVKTFPGVTSAPTALAYDLFSITTDDRTFIQISL